MSRKKGKKKHESSEGKLAAIVLVLEIVRAMVELITAIASNLTE